MLIRPWFSKKKRTISLFCVSLFFSFASLADKKECEYLGGDRNKNSRLYQCGNIKVLKLKGSRKEKGEAQAYWMDQKRVQNKRINFKTLTYFRSQFKNQSFLARTLTNYLVGSELDKESEVSKELKAMSKALDFSWNEFKVIFALPDIGALDPSLSTSLPSVVFKNFKFPGCTSITTLSKDDETFFYGRNLDYSLVGVYDQNPLMVIRYPKKGENKLKTVAFSTHGFFLPSITAMNEKGLIYSLHQTYSKLLTLKGVPILALGDGIVSQSKNIDEAVKMLKKRQSGTMWNINLADLNSGEIAYLYVSQGFAKDYRIKKPKNFAISNHFFDDFMKQFQLIPFSTLKNSLFRQKKAEELLKQKENKMSVKELAGILGYQSSVDSPQIFNDIGKGVTVQTVLWKSSMKGAKKKEVYISEGKAPTSLSSFLKFDFNELFSDFSQGLSYERVKFFDTKRHLRKAELALAYETDIHLLKKLKKKPGDKILRRELNAINKKTYKFSSLYSIYRLYMQRKYHEVITSVKGMSLYFYPSYIKDYFEVLRGLSFLKTKKGYKMKTFEKSCDPYLRKTKALAKTSFQYQLSSGGFKNGFYSLKEFDKKCLE